MKIFPKSSADFPSQLIAQNGIIGPHLNKSFTRERNGWLGSHVGNPRPVMLVSPGDLLAMHIFGPHPRPTSQKLCGWAQQTVFTSSPGETDER